jgi:hypothetical protein
MLQWLRNSWTVRWGVLKTTIGSMSLAVWGVVDTLVHDSDVKTAITNLNIPPKWALALAVLGVITVAVRVVPHMNEDA